MEIARYGLAAQSCRPRLDPQRAQPGALRGRGQPFGPARPGDFRQRGEIDQRGEIGAAGKGERIDLEVGMAKLFASEMCGEVTLEAMRIHGGYGYIKDFDVERYYRDAPLMIIGEGTNEIQKLVIARRLLEKYSI